MSATAMDRLPRHTLYALLAVLAAILAPHAGRLPWWLLGAIALAGASRLWVGVRGGRLPSRSFLIAVTVAASAGVLLQYGTLLGRDAGVALLAVLTGLKLLEMRSRRDTLVVLYLAYFLVITEFLYDQSLPVAGYMLITTWATTFLLVSLGRRNDHRLEWQHAGRAAVMLLQSLPVMMALFVLFPRVPGPLWGMPDDAFTGLTGLGDKVSPGALSQLSRSDAVAFRVRFHSAVPPPDQRYWRAMVLSAYDGRTWQRVAIPGGPPPVQLRGKAVSYTITAEPTNRRWLFALDMPQAAPGVGTLNPEYTLATDKPIRDVRRYRLTSYPHYELEPHMSPQLQRAYTALPVGAHPRTVALAERWAAASADTAALVHRALAYFRNRPFVYTLRPPRLTGDTTDEFLFDTRRGFCEHFADAFAVIMRAAGVPSRLVAGYLGGEPGPTGDYWIVRQSDAHAWVEIWIDGRGWRRVDPTAAVSPERIELGLGGAVPAGDPVPLMARPGGGLLRDLRLGWDVLDATWTRWVLGYGPDMQQALLSDVGLGDWRRMGAAVAAVLIVFMALMAAWALHNQIGGRSREPALRCWREAERRLAGAGLPRAPHEGPRDYGARVARERPELAPVMTTVVEAYVRLRYGRGTRDGDLRLLRAAVRRLKP